MSTNYLTNELVRSHFELAVRSRMQELEHTELRPSIESEFNLAADQSATFWPEFESPLEGVFFVWFTAYQYPRHSYRAERQYWIETQGLRYRADFAILPMDMTRTKLPVLVEVDGHAFHEKTKEQVTERNQRDRILQVAGYQVLHFSYSEMTGQPEWCIGEVLFAARCQFDAEFRRRFMGRT